MNDKNLIAGIDIGGTGTKIGIVDFDGKIIAQALIDTREFSTMELFVSACIKKISSLSNLHRLAGIGIGAPNGNYYSGCVENAPNLPWRGKLELAGEFTKQSGLKAILTNDANAAALGEMMFGGAKGIGHFFYITLGTGVGSGIVADGKLIYGHDGMAGELGHTIAVKGGRMCGCGRKGCLEMYASVRGLVLTARELISQYPGQSALESKIDFSAKDISDAAKNGDAIALKTFDITAEILAISLANASAVTSPSHIFIFGGLAKSGELLMVPLKKYYEQSLLNVYQNKVCLSVSELPDSDAAILGAAALIRNYFM
ncbi:MAG TPA: ROK family protein [Bacteroidales bacterium]|nr:ROK family protein [Bacteroidales bacterium]